MVEDLEADEPREPSADTLGAVAAEEESGDAWGDDASVADLEHAYFTQGDDPADLLAPARGAPYAGGTLREEYTPKPLSKRIRDAGYLSDQQWESLTDEYLVRSGSARVGTGRAARLPAGEYSARPWLTWLSVHHQDLFVYVWNAVEHGCSIQAIGQAFGISTATVSRQIALARELYERRADTTYRAVSRPSAPPRRKLPHLVEQAAEVLDLQEILQADYMRPSRLDDDDYYPDDDDEEYAGVALPPRGDSTSMEEELEEYKAFVDAHEPPLWDLLEVGRPQYGGVAEIARRNGWDEGQLGLALATMWEAFVAWRAEQGRPVQHPCPHALPEAIPAHVAPRQDGRRQRGAANEQKIVAAIDELTARCGRPPSQRELAKHLGLASASQLTGPLKRLREQGRLHRGH